MTTPTRTDSHWQDWQQHDEAQLLEALQRGDETAFEYIVRAHSDRMLAVARGLLGNEEDARDAVQEALLAAVRHIGSFRGSSRISTWLHPIVVNCCRMALRRRRVRPERLCAAVAETPATGRAAVTGNIEREEEIDAVRAGIARLPEQHRHVLTLRVLRSLSGTEAARTLGVSTNAVKTRLYRAKGALREELRPLFGLANAG